MLRGFLCACLVAGCVGAASVAAGAQEVVHALTGTVSSVDPVSKSVTIFTDNGSQSLFKNVTGSKARYVLDKKIRVDASATDTLSKTGAYVIVFFFGDDNTRTAVAVRSLGSGPFTSAVGTVVEFEGREHSISVKDSSGAVQTFKITSDTVGESGIGATEGFKFQVQKGDEVRVVATTVNGGATALFIQQK